MLAKLQQLIAFAIVATTAAWVAWCVQAGIPQWAAAWPALLAAAYVGVLGLEFAWLYRSYAREDRSRPKPVRLVAAWLAEAVTGPLVFLWRQPFRSRTIADRVPAAPGGPRGIVLVHGFFCNRGLWNPWLARYAAAGRPFVAVNLEPVLGSIDRYVDTIDAAVSRLHGATGRPPVIVAHSMGGLAVRAWLAERGDGDRFHRIVTIATPHGGTWMARHGRTANALQMKADGGWLAQLAERENVALRSRFTCFWGHCDNIVFPTAKATLDGARNVHLEATPHVRMAFHPAIAAAVDALADEPR